MNSFRNRFFHSALKKLIQTLNFYFVINVIIKGMAYGEYLLKRHMLNFHKDDSEYIKCENCDYKTARRDRLRRHNEEVHLGIKKFRDREEKCLMCSFKCTKKSNLSTHMESVHNTSLELVYCDQCTFSSHYKTSLVTHKNSCKNKTYFTAHVNSKHLGITFSCGVCDYTSSSAQMVQRHTQGKHGGGFPCPHCSYRATQPGQLSLHVKAIHEKVKFNCNLCPFSTSFQTNLYAHVRKCH